jgi:hypothetical protein
LFCRFGFERGLNPQLFLFLCCLKDGLFFGLQPCLLESLHSSSLAYARPLEQLLLRLRLLLASLLLRPFSGFPLLSLNPLPRLAHPLSRTSRLYLSRCLHPSHCGRLGLGFLLRLLPKPLEQHPMRGFTLGRMNV